MRDPEDTCEHCPAFAKGIDYDGKEVLVPMTGNDGKPITENGAIQHEKTTDGRFVMSGSCRLRAPVLMMGPAGMSANYPPTKSNWWCEDPDRHAMLTRMGK